MNGIGNDLTGKIISNQYLQDIAEGKIPGRSILFIFGSNPLVGAIYEDIWDNGGLITFPTIEEDWEILSDSPNDHITGTGAQKIIVGFMNINHETQFIQEFEMNGETPIPFTGSNQFIFQAAAVFEAGTGDKNEGFITIRKVGGGAGSARGGISPGENLSAYGTYVTPAGHTLYIFRSTANINKNEDIQTKILANSPNINPRIFFRINEISLYQTTYNETYISAILPEKTWLRPQARSSDVEAIANIYIQGILVKDGF